MAERKAKPKPGESVLASLPSTRPNRMGSRRRGPAKAKAKPAAAAKPKPVPRAKAKPKAKAVAKPRAVKAAPEPTPIAKGAAARPKPVKSAAKKLAAAQKKSATKRKPIPPAEKQPSGTELVTTVVQAAGELAQVGLSIGGQVLKRAVDRLPKP